MVRPSGSGACLRSQRDIVRFSYLLCYLGRSIEKAQLDFTRVTHTWKGVLLTSVQLSSNQVFTVK